MDLNSPRGTADIFGEELGYRNFIEGTAKKLFSLFNYQEIKTPAFEHTEVFSRGIGENTDIVQKEMYTFEDKKGRSLTLRPEGTASVVRAIIEHKLYSGRLPLKVYYNGNMFRYERPQKGRMREFHQLGVEAVGVSNPAIDAEVIWLANQLFGEIGFKDLTLLVNSIGCHKCRKDFIKKFKAYIEPKKDKLCRDCKNRFSNNPLRIFDCKKKSCVNVISNSPKIYNYLCKDCREHIEKVIAYLKNLNINYEIDYNLVRGFDYYTKTIFEVISRQIKSAQNALGGGGRYDHLIGQFGGPDMPAIGFAIGVDRTAMLMKQLGIKPRGRGKKKKVYLIAMDESYYSFLLEVAKFLRNIFICEINFSIKSVGSELKWAEKNNFDFAIIIGEQEVKDSKITVKDIRAFKQYEFNWLTEKDNLMEFLKGK
ncbi:MAG: histidine--tRNA ligase [Actinomycetota bacterium]